MANKVKVGGKNGLECHGDPLGNNATVEKLKFKWKVGDEEKSEKAVQDAPGCLDKKRLAEKDYFEAIWKILSARRLDVPVPKIGDHIVCAIKDYEDQLSGKNARIDGVQTAISELDRNVTKATEIRKKQHA